MSRNTIKITSDDKFVWKILTLEQAKAIFLSQTMSVYALHDDESESLIMDEEELEEAISNGSELGIEVGFANYKEVAELKNLIENHDFHFRAFTDGASYNKSLAEFNRIYELSSQVPQEDYIRWWNRAAPESFQFISTH